MAMSSCEGPLLCTAHDPTAGGRLCPISRRRYKRDIEYLDARETRRLHDELLKFRLASYAYRTDPSEKHLGFIIDDIGRSPAVAPDGHLVDLYGYASMAVAAIQTQASEIAELRRQVAALEKALEQRSRAARRPRPHVPH